MADLLLVILDCTVTVYNMVYVFLIIFCILQFHGRIILQLQPFNSLFSRTSWVSQYQKGKKSGFYWSKRE